MLVALPENSMSSRFLLETLSHKSLIWQTIYSQLPNLYKIRQLNHRPQIKLLTTSRWLACHSALSAWLSASGAQGTYQGDVLRKTKGLLLFKLSTKRRKSMILEPNKFLIINPKHKAWSIKKWKDPEINDLVPAILKIRAPNDRLIFLS